ncbi:DNA replication and repair protein RecO [Nostoc sp. PCC 7524]|uniref:DNA repair protein RecO n=1 Tax=Nostoc sp. (strain ATCC 29411 / PCC 7524) TaxID=28072 RepID=UPI00029F3FF6|nr:DNA repair protein RecO [Nostoc sp. PCC 7524]AFY50697.1 DNA replication and repair protein RecO [Nostoc sp. PCC 7524]
MSKTYKATGINLKTQVLGESDKIVTILTREFGLIRAVAPGARKHNSSLGGRSGMFVVNELLIAKGRSLDKITQAQTVKTYPGLSQDLGKLAASQYLAEIVLCQALSEHPQEELYELLNEHLQRLEALPRTEPSSILACLAHAVFHLLALAGLTPQVQTCCLTQRPLMPDSSNPNWQVGFSIPCGGIICLEAWENLRKEANRSASRQGRAGEQGRRTVNQSPVPSPQSPVPNPQSPIPSPQSPKPDYQTVVHRQELPVISVRLNAQELAMLQQMSQPEIMQINNTSYQSWLSVEQILRQYAQYHLGRPIRSATLIDSYFAANHDTTV